MVGPRVMINVRSWSAALAALRARCSSATAGHCLLPARAMSVSLHVSPARCLFDEPLRVSVSGLSPGQEVTLQAAVTDEAGEAFTSCGRYRAGSCGELTLSHSPALEGGSYTGVEPDGPLWSLQPRSPLGRFALNDVQSPIRLQLSLYRDHQPLGPLLAAASQERGFLGAEVRRIPVREGKVRGSLFLPPGSGPFPAILDLYGMGGGLMEHRASLLASRGFLTLALAYFAYDDLPKDIGGLHLSYFMEALQFLRSLPQEIARELQDGSLPFLKSSRSSVLVNNQEVGVIGLSKGADLAVSMATFLSGIKAVVSVSGCSANSLAPLHCEGLTLPGLGFNTEKIKFTELGVLDFSEAMDDPKDPANESCLIPAEKSTAAFLFLSGSDDMTWPSSTYSEQILLRLRAHGKNVESHTYPGAGHLFEPPYLPFCRACNHKLLGIPILWGGNLREHARAQKDGWQKILNFLSKHLMQFNSTSS